MSLVAMKYLTVIKNLVGVFQCNCLVRLQMQKKVITYAASCGQTSFEQLTDDKKEKIKCALRNLNAISVRDKNTMDFVNAFGYRQCNYSLDPTLVYDFSKDLSISSTSKGKYNNICLIYAYQDRISDPREISYIKEFCKKKKD